MPRFSDMFLHQLLQRNLVYNICWEDPRIDRKLLEIRPGSRVLMITSAGCNALEYLLDKPAEIHCTDINPRQNALLELKIRMAEHLEWADFFQFFGEGAHPQYRDHFDKVLPMMSDPARRYWSKRVRWFDPESPRGSFFFHGNTGTIAWIVHKFFFPLFPNFHRDVTRFADAPSLEVQNELYNRMESRRIFRIICRMLETPFFMTSVGISKQQIRMINRELPGGLHAYNLEIFRKGGRRIPMTDNYFWQAYLKGTFTLPCVPGYLNPENFEPVRAGLSAIKIYDQTVTRFLEQASGVFTHFVLLDHMDWLAGHDRKALEEEWRQILQHSQPGTRILFRSAGFTTAFLPEFVTQKVTFHPEITIPLHQTDRVCMYGSVHLGIVNG